MISYKEKTLTITLEIGDWEHVSACINDSLEMPASIKATIADALYCEYSRLGLTDPSIEKIEKFKAALSWMANEEPQLVEAAVEKFKLNH